MLRLFASALVALALVTGTALAAKGGPAPGVSVGWDGTVDSSGAVRYVALPAATTTTIAAVRTSDGRVLRYRTIRGVFGIPLVAFDGTAEGVSRDGRTLLLADVAARAGADALRRPAHGDVPASRRAITLPGRWAYDALSPDGRILYATQYLGTGANPRYQVRSVSLISGKPFGAPLVDKREPDEEMNGSPWARVRSANGAWAYTLYAKPNGTGFVHALDTAEAAGVLRRSAVADHRAAARRRAPVARERRSHARAGEAGREPARRRRHDDVQGDGLREAVARRLPPGRPRSPSRSPRRPRRCRGWR